MLRIYKQYTISLGKWGFSTKQEATHNQSRLKTNIHKKFFLENDDHKTVYRIEEELLWY